MLKLSVIGVCTLGWPSRGSSQPRPARAPRKVGRPFSKDGTSSHPHQMVGCSVGAHSGSTPKNPINSSHRKHQPYVSSANTGLDFSWLELLQWLE